jgi:subtilisin family serine protease
VRWEILHVPTLRIVAKIRGLRATLTLVDPGEYRILVSATGAETRTPCTSLPFGFALRSTPTLADPGQIPPLPTLERLGILFPHLVTIEAIPAQVKTAQGEGVTVAIIDTGVHYNHPDLHPQISTTARGWNFVEGDDAPFDSHGHGTQVAGLVAAVGYGVAPRAKLLPIRVINAFGGSDALSVAAAIRYASEQGARVINLSLGTEDPAASPLLEEAIRAVTARGALVVAASGNGALDGTGLDLESHPVYPAALEIPGLVTVLATDLRGERTEYTHYSAKKVAMGAPGGTDQDGGLSSANAYLSLGRLRPLMGSSASAPLVSGAAALLWSSVPTLTNTQIQRILENSGTQSPSLRGATRSGGTLNAYSAALQALQEGAR